MSEDERKLISGILTADDEEATNYFARARAAREERFGKKVFLRAVVEFANDCVNDCLYCGLRRSNKQLPRFRLSDTEIWQAAQTVKEMGIPTLFLQSAEDPAFGTARLAALTNRITRDLGLEVILCVGAKTVEEFRTLYAAGARKVIIKHETADAALFRKMKPDLTFATRIKNIKSAQKAGFAVGSGVIIGLPDQTVASLTEDILLMKRLKVAMASCSIFIPHENTPLGNNPPGDPHLGARFIAATRLILPDALIPATSTFEKALPGKGQALALAAGANVITVNVTPETHKPAYQLYTDRYYVRLNHALSLAAEAGLTVAAEPV